jgi:hypothetical protein
MPRRVFIAFAFCMASLFAPSLASPAENARELSLYGRTFALPYFCFFLSRDYGRTCVAGMIRHTGLAPTLCGA